MSKKFFVDGKRVSAKKAKEVKMSREVYIDDFEIEGTSYQYITIAG